MAAERLLRALIAECDGMVSVERFMQEALYHPQHGYYSRKVRDLGRRGDFSTSATLHGALGRAVAAWAVRHRGAVALRGRWHLIELGGGSGELAAEIRRGLGWWGRVGLRYHVVEVSEPLRTAQQKRLAGWKGARWHDEIGDALRAAEGRALIFSNEFVDAFPCVQLVRDDATGRWREACIAWPENAVQPVEVTGEWRGPALNLATEEAGAPRVEVHFTYQRWLASWLPLWRAGRMLTIDYGDTVPGLYHRRPHGTLRAYCHHKRFTGLDVFQRFGQQDLTADVNFTDLQAWGTELGLTNDSFGTQAEFLRRWLARRWLARRQADPALAFLLEPDGAGGAFKVLDQVRRTPQNAA